MLADDEPLGRSEAIELASLRGPGVFELLSWASRVRRAHFGDEVKFCSIVAGKVGGCSEDCKWCAQSARYPTGVPTAPARSSGDEMARAAAEAAGNGAASFGIVNSGRRPGEVDLQAIEQAMGALRDNEGLQCCASLGHLDAPTARRLYAAGMRRYNHNLETSRRLYGEMVTTHTYDDRLAALAAARNAGMGLCCGGIFGLGETWADRVDLALTLRNEVHPDVTPLNFLHAIDGTPMADAETLSPIECLHIIALFRMLLPAVDLKVAGGREVNLRDMQSWIFHAGATSCLVGNYLTTIGRDARADRRMVADLGLELVRRFSRETPPEEATIDTVDAES